ncbi:MAG TPA: TonB-dependent receptor [Xanthomonadales bacterium]|nr:TonB-dependent receptor [Xanthomonadales bacterium]
MFRRSLYLAVHAALAVVSFAAVAQSPSAQPEVVVTATRVAEPETDTLASVTVITREEIERTQAPDLLELLRLEAGIDVNRTGGIGQSTGFFLRGTASNQSLVLIDGIRVASANSGLFDFAHLPLEQIDRIEIVRGPRASWWGADAIGGVIQVFTRQPEGAVARARGGTYSTFGGSAGYGVRGERGGFHATLGGTVSDGFSATTPDNFSYDPDDDGYINRNLTVGGDATLGTQRLSGQFIGTLADVEFDEGITDARNHSLGATLAGPLAAHWTHSLTLGSAREDLTTPAFFALFHSRRETADWINQFEVGDDTRIGAGLNYVHEAGETRDTFSGLPQYEATRTNRAAFANVRTRAGAFDGELAARHDDNSAFGGESTFQAAGAWRFDGGRVFASYGEGFRAPTLNELYSPGFGGLFAGNPDLDPERSRSAELGADWAAGAHDLSLRAYRTRVRDLVDFSGGETFQAINVKRAEIDGAEAEWDWRVGAGWTLGATATYDRARDEDTNVDLVRRPRRKLVARVGQEAGTGLAWGVDAQYASSRRDFGGTLDPYTVVAGWVDWRFASDWRAGLRVDNAFDREYALVAGYATPGRAFLLTLAWEPGR